MTDFDLYRHHRVDFRYRGATEYPPALLHHSALMPANLITLAHFSVSVAISLLKSSGEPVIGDAPKSASRVRIVASLRQALICLLSLFMFSDGVSFGAQNPNQTPISNPGRNSPTVGTSGNAGDRVVLVIASARNLPSLMCPSDAGNTPNITCTTPLSRSVIAGASPR